MAGNKTPDYMRKAIDRYNSKYDRITANTPAGFKERLKAVTDASPAAFVAAAAVAALEVLEREKGIAPAADQDKTTE